MPTPDSSNSFDERQWHIVKAGDSYYVRRKSFDHSGLYLYSITNGNYRHYDAFIIGTDTNLPDVEKRCAYKMLRQAQKDFFIKDQVQAEIRQKRTEVLKPLFELARKVWPT